MTANKHTKGPWHHEVTNSARTSYVVVSADGLANGSTVVIGQCAGPDRLENARLIAATLELLEVARHCENLFMSYALDRTDGDEIADAALALIRAAIEKATGGAA